MPHLSRASSHASASSSSSSSSSSSTSSRGLRLALVNPSLCRQRRADVPRPALARKERAATMRVSLQRFWEPNDGGFSSLLVVGAGVSSFSKTLSIPQTATFKNHHFTALRRAPSGTEGRHAASARGLLGKRERELESGETEQRELEEETTTKCFFSRDRRSLSSLFLFFFPPSPAERGSFFGVSRVLLPRSG